jgi:2-polyprenyl-3-methyl-5-hydroxy-6-metoxy-1,4-benzoquinol methylase
VPNPDQVKKFAGKILNIYTGSVLTKLIDIGYQTGLFEASRSGPATSKELSERAGLQERYVREWLGAMVTSDIYRYDVELERYSLPEEHAVLLTGETAQNQCPSSRIINHFGKHLPKLIECFRVGGGVSYSEFRPEFTECMDDAWRRIFDDQLISGFMGSVEGIVEALETGIRVLDIGCGTGHATNVLARGFPNSTFIGYDIAEDAIDSAKAEAEEMGLTNSTFDVVDVSTMEVESKFDLITAFDAVHDQKEPEAVLRGVRDALAPTGTFLMIEFKFSSEVHENIGNPFAPLYYGISLMHCTTVSLASGGPGLGAVWGEQTARRMLAEAGFGYVAVVDTPRPQNYLFVCRQKPRTS